MAVLCRAKLARSVARVRIDMSLCRSTRIHDEIGKTNVWWACKTRFDGAVLRAAVIAAIAWPVRRIKARIPPPLSNWLSLSGTICMAGAALHTGRTRYCASRVASRKNPVGRACDRARGAANGANKTNGSTDSGSGSGSGSARARRNNPGAQPRQRQHKLPERSARLRASPAETPRTPSPLGAPAGSVWRSEAGGVGGCPIRRLGAFSSKGAARGLGPVAGRPGAGVVSFRPP